MSLVTDACFTFFHKKNPAIIWPRAEISFSIRRIACSYQTKSMLHGAARKPITNFKHHSVCLWVFNWNDFHVEHSISAFDSVYGFHIFIMFKAHCFVYSCGNNRRNTSIFQFACVSFGVPLVGNHRQKKNSCRFFLFSFEVLHCSKTHLNQTPRSFELFKALWSREKKRLTTQIKIYWQIKTKHG